LRLKPGLPGELGAPAELGRVLGVEEELDGAGGEAIAVGDTSKAVTW